ncbi:MAG: hypothetical protein ABIJ57_00120 [Pseudomonadota bacterium]
MDRITKRDLAVALKNLTEATGITGLQIDRAYGGCKLVQVINAQGGESDVIHTGHIPARDLYNRMFAAVEVIRYAKWENRDK